MLITVFNEGHYKIQSHISTILCPLEKCEQEHHPTLAYLKNWPMKCSAKYHTNIPLDDNNFTYKSISHYMVSFNNEYVYFDVHMLIYPEKKKNELSQLLGACSSLIKFQMHP